MAEFLGTMQLVWHSVELQGIYAINPAHDFGPRCFTDTENPAFGNTHLLANPIGLICIQPVIVIALVSMVTPKTKTQLKNKFT